MIDKMQLFTFLFLMLGPFKVIGPFAKITMGADPSVINKLALRAIAVSTLALLLAGLMGQVIVTRYGIPVQILALSGAIILFLVALLNIIHQFGQGLSQTEKAAPPTMNMAVNPIAFPIIVTPYGIAAVIVFLSLYPDLHGRITIGAMVLGIMGLNLITMLITRFIFKPLAIVLALLGAVLGVVQVALGLMIIFNQTKAFLNL